MCRSVWRLDLSSIEVEAVRYLTLQMFSTRTVLSPGCFYFTSQKSPRGPLRSSATPPARKSFAASPQNKPMLQHLCPSKLYSKSCSQLQEHPDGPWIGLPLIFTSEVGCPQNIESTDTSTLVGRRLPWRLA